MNNDIDGLQDVLGAPDISQGQLKATAGAIFITLYGEKKTNSLNTARYEMYMSRKKPLSSSRLGGASSSDSTHSSVRYQETVYCQDVKMSLIVRQGYSHQHIQTSATRLERGHWCIL